MNRIFRFKLVLLAVLLLSKIEVYAQADPIEHVWFNEEKTARVQVYKAKDGKFYGKIVWLKEPNRDGKPKVDDKNPDARKRTQPILGLLLLKSFSKDGDSKYEDGTIYDPKNGKTYSCKMTIDGNKLEVRGYVGFSLIGRTTTWTLAE